MPGSGRTWTIKGVGDDTREAVLDAALAANLTVGDWVERALARAVEEARHPRPPTASRAEVAEVVQRAVRWRRACGRCWSDWSSWSARPPVWSGQWKGQTARRGSRPQYGGHTSGRG